MTTPDEQLTLDLPESTEHGVVYSEGVLDTRFPATSLLDAKSQARTLLYTSEAEEKVAWDDEPKTSGHYGVERGTGVVHRIAAY